MTISIHALREEGDYSLPTAREQPYQFLSTPSARRATSPPRTLDGTVMISIHALREEGDFYLRVIKAVTAYFYPRPPRGGRLHFFF